MYLAVAGGAPGLAVIKTGPGPRQLCAVPGDDNALVLATCLAAGAKAEFKLNHNNTGPTHARPQPVVHTASGKCVQSNGAKAGLALAPCQTDDASQLWVFGSSGRFCKKGGGVCWNVGP